MVVVMILINLTSILYNLLHDANVVRLWYRQFSDNDTHIVTWIMFVVSYLTPLLIVILFSLFVILFSLFCCIFSVKVDRHHWQFSVWQCICIVSNVSYFSSTIFLCSCAGTRLARQTVITCPTLANHDDSAVDVRGHLPICGDFCCHTSLASFHLTTQVCQVTALPFEMNAWDQYDKAFAPLALRLILQ